MQQRLRFFNIIGKHICLFTSGVKMANLTNHFSRPHHFIDRLIGVISIDKVEQINCAVLVVHGEQDRVTPIEQAREIVASCSSSVRPLFLDNIGHWDIELSPEYLNRVRDFIDKDMIKA